MNPVIFNRMNTQGDLILDQNMLQMPIKKSKEIQDLLKLKIQQKKLIEQVHSKAKALKQSRALSQQNNNIFKDSSSFLSSVQKDVKMNQQNSNYIVSCVMRALKYRKLAIDDIADIFGIDAEIVQEIDRFRRIQQFQCGGDPSMKMPNQKLDVKKQKLIKQLQMRFKNKQSINRFEENSFSAFSEFGRKSNFSLADSRVSHGSNFSRLSNFGMSSIIQSAQKHKDEQNIFEYQKLLRSKPPHRLDDKVRAIVDVLKKHPNIMQKQIIQVLAKDYGITNMTQTSISRYYKRIYEMKKHCQVLLKAKKDGFIDI